MFTYEIPCKVIFGQGVSGEVGKIAKDLGAKSVFVVYDQGIKQAGIADEVIKALQQEELEVNVFEEVMANPTDGQIAEAASRAKKLAVDTLIGLGGGSSLDAAKAINILLTNDGQIQEYEGVNLVKEKPLPLIAIPTTAGTASEVTSFTIVTNTAKKKKMVIAGCNVGAAVALIDPNLTINLPAHITAQTGMDALTHAAEAYLSVLATPLTDVNALKAIELIYNHLETCVKSGTDSEAREKVMMGCVLAGFAFNSAVLGLAHGIAHPLGALFNIPHGLANAIVLPEVMAFNGQAVPQRIVEIGQAMGLTRDDLTVDAIVTKVKELNKKIGIPGLYETDVKQADFDMLAKATLLESCLFTNPRKVEYADVIGVLERSGQ